MNTSAAKRHVLAIDGGGTHCRFALACAPTPADLAQTSIVIEGGPANVTSDFNSTVRCINQGLEDLACGAELDTEALYELPAFVGLAGVTGDNIARQLENSLPLRNAIYSEDRLAALRGAFGVNDGFIVHCGTGSFFASQINGVHRFAGGWGAILGDEASANWIGRKALSVTLQKVDGLVSISPLTREILKRYKSTDAIIDFASKATPKRFGELAPLVTTMAAEGDVNALLIMNVGADYIAQGIQRMGYKAGMPVCLTGGLAPHYEPYLPDNITNALTQAAGSPLAGAIALAFEHAETVDERR